MRPIPPKMREELFDMSEMKQCAVFLLAYGPCDGRIEWHHVWTYAGKQINETWAILGVCKRHHDMVNQNWLLRDSCMRASLRKATDEDLAKYPRKDWNQIKRSLGQ